MRAGGQTTCDFDGKPLYGRFGTAWIEKEHLSFNGTFTLQLKGDFVYVSKNPTDEHHFCGGDCLLDFIEYQKTQYLKKQHNHRLQDLRRQAEHQHP